MTASSPSSSITGTIHGTAVQIAGKGILLRGASGSGKTSLAMRLLDDCALYNVPGLLVADDRVIIERDREALFISGPESLAGLMEIRGLGILRVDHCPKSPLNLIVDLVPDEAFERYPDPDDLVISIQNVNIDRLAIVERNPDATAIIRTYMRAKTAHLSSSPIET